MKQLQGKRALVTGGGQGIGRAIVEELLRQGCHVAIHYHSSAAGAEDVKRLAPSATRVDCFMANLTEETAAVNMVKAAVSFLGGLDILINNTGDLVDRRKVEEIDLEFWRKVLDVNLTSMMLVTRQAVPFLVQGMSSSIVNLASTLDINGGVYGS